MKKLIQGLVSGITFFILHLANVLLAQPSFLFYWERLSSLIGSKALEQRRQIHY